MRDMRICRKCPDLMVKGGSPRYMYTCQLDPEVWKRNHVPPGCTGSAGHNETNWRLVDRYERADVPDGCTLDMEYFLLYDKLMRPI